MPDGDLFSIPLASADALLEERKLIAEDGGFYKLAQVSPNRLAEDSTTAR